MNQIQRIALLYSVLIVAIIVLAGQSNKQYLINLVHVLPFGDKLGHFILIGVLALVVNLSLQCARWRWGRITLLKGSVLVAVVVTLEELSQLFISTRSFDLGDLAADFLGIVVFGQLALWLYQRTLKPNDS